ncbi:hypothetical protein [Streptomyces sp. GbtcB6]|uniref:hypothetical protein n=1 Tax=Streptomyces sp. GbtcB6 TaxID=2824751 RepID=UPI001C30431C|nr:hypothetical protein [Streptomyces sp. GbtcB6]
MQGAGESVGGEDVQVGVADEGGGADHRVEVLLEAGPYVAGAAVAVGDTVGAVGGTDERGQGGAFDVIQAQGAGEDIEDVLGDAADVATLNAGVLLDADGCELGDF